MFSINPAATPATIFSSVLIFEPICFLVFIPSATALLVAPVTPSGTLKPDVVVLLPEAYPDSPVTVPVPGITLVLGKGLNLAPAPPPLALAADPGKANGFSPLIAFLIPLNASCLTKSFKSTF